jgi:hypothetical protein
MIKSTAIDNDRMSNFFHITILLSNWIAVLSFKNDGSSQNNILSPNRENHVLSGARHAQFEGAPHGITSWTKIKKTEPTNNHAVAKDFLFF